MSYILYTEMEEIETDAEKNHMLFLFKWNGGGIEGKLKCYGLTKLKKLAKIKGLNGYLNNTKDELINLLKPITKQNDFPIR